MLYNIIMNGYTVNNGWAWLFLDFHSHGKINVLNTSLCPFSTYIWQFILQEICENGDEHLLNFISVYFEVSFILSTSYSVLRMSILLVLLIVLSCSKQENNVWEKLNPLSVMIQLLNGRDGIWTQTDWFQYPRSSTSCSTPESTQILTSRLTPKESWQGTRYCLRRGYIHVCVCVKIYIFIMYN